MVANLRGLAALSMDTDAFFDLLYGDIPSPNDVCLSLWERKSHLTAHVPLSDRAEVRRTLKILDDAKRDAYFGVGLRRPGLTPQQRGKKKDVVYIPGFWTDVDVAGEGHHSHNLPSADEAIALLDEFPFRPTILIDTGGGYHAYYLFHKPLQLTPSTVTMVNNAAKRFGRRLIDIGLQRGFHVDATSNIDRVLRPPGTNNWKLETARPVRVLVVDLEDRYEVQQLLVEPPTSVSAQVPADPNAPPLPVDDILLADLRRNLIHLGNPESRKVIAPVLKGEPFAEMGGRDDTLQRIVSIIAFVAPTGADPEVLVRILEPSLEAMAAEDDDPENPCPTIDDAIEKLTRAQEDADRERANAQAFRVALAGVFKTDSQPPSEQQPSPGQAGAGAPVSDGGAGSNPLATAETAAAAAAEPEPPAEKIPDYTEDDIRRFAKKHNVSPPGFARRFIIQHTGAYYVFFDGEYRYPVPKEALLTKLRDDLAPAEKLGIRLTTIKQDGGVRKLNVQEVMDFFGTVARQAKGSLVRQESMYDAATDIFYESVCPKRKLEPVYDPVVNEWLVLLGGEQHNLLLSWLATATNLDRQSAALYLSGKAGAGKTMLAHGIARIWTTGGPTELVDAADTNFNEGLARCPIIFGDEAISCTTADLRRLVGSNMHTLRRKYLSNVELEGALRVILADNGARMLIQDKEEFSGDDLEAVASKFLHITVGEEPVNYLKGIGGRTGTADWVAGDRIAKHVLWLSENVKVIPGNRFAVEGQQTSMTRVLAVQGRVPGLICEWIVAHLGDKLNSPPVQDKLVSIGGGQLLINVDAVCRHWGLYIHSDAKPFNRTRVGTSLNNLSAGTKRVGTRRYHIVKPDLLYAWSEQNGFGDVASMRARIEAPLKNKLEEVPIE